MLLTLENLMGFVVNSEKQMRMLKDGEKTCMLSTSCAKTDRLVKYVSLHGGFGMRQRRAGYHMENLVGTLRNRKGRCMMGPFEDAESLWRASQGGVAFKLGMSFRELKTMMQMEPRNPLYVYRFHSVEIDVRVKWYDFYQPCSGGRRPRNRTEMPEYDTKEACGSPHIQFGLHLEGPPAVPRGMSRTLWMGRVATRTPRGNFNLEQMLVEKRPMAEGGKARKKYKERKPVETWSMHGSAQPYSQVVVENGTAAGAVLSNPLTMEPYYQLGPPDFLAVCGGGTSMSEFNAVYQGGDETVLLEPVGPVVVLEAFAEIVDPAQDVYGMLFDTLEVCKRLRLEGCETGMGAWRLESLGLIEDSIEDIQAALDNGETDAVVDALNDLRRAIGEYGWGMQMNEKDGKGGISHDKIERVRRLWRAVKTLEGGLATIVEV